jgi:hypothetical protein
VIELGKVLMCPKRQMLEDRFIVRLMRCSCGLSRNLAIIFARNDGGCGDVCADHRWGGDNGRNGLEANERGLQPR